jgi:hypothetical protein
MLLSRQLIIYFLLCLTSIVMVKEFTFGPEAYSGNGNPVILLFPFVILTFSLFGFEWFVRLRETQFQSKIWVQLLMWSLVLLIASIILEIFFVKDLVQQLGGTPTNADSRIYRYPWLNQYTNTLFVNVYTFLIYFSSLTLFITLSRIKDKS